MPWRDWQFWLVSALALWGLWMVLRTVWPARKSTLNNDPSCPSCSSGPAPASKFRRRVPLTIERKRI